MRARFLSRKGPARVAASISKDTATVVSESSVVDRERELKERCDRAGDQHLQAMRLR